MTERMTAAQFRAQTARPLARPRQHKFGAKSIVIDGHHFPSLLEGRRYQGLKLRLRAGDIKDLKLQPKFVLDGPGGSIGAYIADFRYFERATRNGCTVWVDVVEDAKGVETPLYKLKRALFLQLYPHVDFREIKKKMKTPLLVKEVLHKNAEAWVTITLDRAPAADELTQLLDHLQQMPRCIALGVAERPIAMEATGADVNTVLQVLVRLTDVGDRQLTTLAVALVVGCISCRVSKDVALGIVAKLFDEPPEIVPLDMGNN